MDFSVHAVAPKQDTFSLSLSQVSVVMSLVHISRLVLVLVVLVVGVMTLEMSPGPARSVQGITGGLLVMSEVVRVISVGAAI